VSSSGEQPWIKTHPAPSLSATAGSWTDLGKSIPTSGWATITLDTAFNCDYGSEIAIPTGANVTIHGNGVVLDAAQKGRFFYVNAGATLALDHLVLRHGFRARGAIERDEYGGAIANSGTLTVQYGSFANNSACGGGAIYNNGGALTVEYGNFTGNSAGSDGTGRDAGGGAIMNNGTLTLEYGSFTGNSCGGYPSGGAIYNMQPATCNIDGGTFLSNTAFYNRGGAIYNQGTLNVTLANFTLNNACTGGAIYNYGGSVAIDGSTTFSGNTCGGPGDREACAAVACGPDVRNGGPPGGTGDFTFAGSRSVSFGG
jgi:predicted outer membrane repeat protein